jgi:hypothetical protein
MMEQRRTLAARGSWMTPLQTTILAPLLLATFPLFMLALFMMYRPPIAVMVSLLIAEMFLPPIYALPISPSWLTKWTLPPIFAGVWAVVFANRQVRRTPPFRGIEGLFAVCLLVNLMTFWTNRDAVHYGPLTVPAEDFKDLFADIIKFFVDPWAAFYLGRALFRSSRDLAALTRLMVIAVLVYSLPILFEIRMAPTLNHTVYGFEACVFETTIRWGGYRPVVFFKDGLPLASFVLAGAIMTVAMARAHMRLVGLSTGALTVFVLFILVICKSTGVILYALLAVPLIVLAPPRRTMTVASLLTVIFLIYPALRFADLVPIKALANSFIGISPDRAGSLLYRFNMEDGLLALTSQRPWWGWGGAWGRNLVYDPHSGQQLSVPDGALIITLSSHGVIGFIGYYLPFALTILRAPKVIRQIRSKTDRRLLAALTLNCAIMLFDLIVNSAFPPLYMLIFGALCSLPEGIVAEEAIAEAATRQEEEAELGIVDGRDVAPVYQR